jgi:hypothetical protein
VRDCRRQLSEAELQLESCALSCRDEQRNYLSARNQFRDSLEQQAEADHQGQVQQLAARQQLERSKAESARQQQALLEQRARDQEHQRQLELIEAQAQQRSLELAAERERKLVYFARLTQDQRRQRLNACHDQHRAACDELAELLIESAPRAVDRRAVLELQERLTTGQAEPVIHLPKPQIVQPPEAAKEAPRTAETCCGGEPSALCPCTERGTTLAAALPAGWLGLSGP